MAAPGDLALLLRRLQAARSPAEKLGLAARAWRTVRAVPRRDRLALAAQIGIEGAEEALERLADGQVDGRISSAEVLRVLEEAEKAGPNRGKELLEALRDPAKQKELLRRGAEAVEEEILQPTAPRAVSPPPIPEEAPAPPVPPPPAAEAAPPPSSPQRPFPETPVPPSQHAAGDVGEAPPPTSMPEQSWSAPAEPPAVPSAAAPPPGPASSALAERLRSTPLASRLRLLRARLHEARALAPPVLRDLVESFPAGWARRRALATLLRAGIPESVSDALALVETLDAPSARLWCYAALLARPELSQGELEAIEEKAPAATARRLATRPDF